MRFQIGIEPCRAERSLRHRDRGGTDGRRAVLAAVVRDGLVAERLRLGECLFGCGIAAM